MSDKLDASHRVENAVTNRSIVPFTSGLLMAIYAFFWPEQYGHWLGTIVRAFRAASGI
jgi:hypothetical protein